MRSSLRARAVVLAALLLAPGPAARAATPAVDPAPLGRGETGAPLAPAWARSPYGAAASESEDASRAAASILEAGGNAVDAAVAGALALGAAAPGSSGLGGQTWIVVHTAAGEDLAFLSPLRAPARVNVARAQMARRGDVMTGPLAPTAPGTVATLARAHARLGRLPWAALFAPAIAIAEKGSFVSEADRLFLETYRDRIEASPWLRPLYTTGACDGEGRVGLVPPGSRVVYPGLATTLRRLAAAGPDDFYRGALAAEMAADFARNDGFLRAEDLARVPAAIIETAPLRGRYRDFEVLALPSPGSGSIVLRALHVLDAFPSALLAGEPWVRAQLLLDSVRVALSDALGVGVDEEVSEGPWRSAWLDPAWGRAMASILQPGRAARPADLPRRGRRANLADRDTTHLSVVDAEGNAVALTGSLGRTWGSTWVTPGLGFPYNAFLEGYELEDPASPQYLRAGTRSRAMVAPTILLRGKRAELVVGAAGSVRIPASVVNAVVGFVDRGLGVAEAVAAPRAIWSESSGNRGARLELAAPLRPEDVDLLRAIGYPDLEAYAPEPGIAHFTALNAVGWSPSARAWEAGAEPRRKASAAVPARAPAAPAGGRSRR